MRKLHTFVLSTPLLIGLAVAPIDQAKASATEPSAPTIVSITSSSSKNGLVNVTVKISLPKTNGGSIITGSKVTAGGKSCLIVNLKNSCIIKGIRNGTALKLKASSKNVNGFGTTSPSVAYKAGASVYKIPIALPVVQDKRITFANAESTYEEIPQTAWENTQNAIAANPVVKIPTTIVIGPKTDTTKEQIISLLQMEYRLWYGFQQPPSYAGLVYNAKDVAWAEKEWPKMATRLKLTENPKSEISQLRAGCNFTKKVATECFGGMAVTFQKSLAGFAFYGVQSPYWAKNSLQVGPISQVTHEYTHNVQFAQWNGAQLKPGENFKSNSAHNGMPCWFSEGQANAIGMPIAAKDLESYFQGRDNSVRRKINVGSGAKPALTNTSLSAKNITKFLYGQNIATCYNPATNNDWQLGYNVGYAATEVLVAIGGPQSTMALLAKSASGLTWANAFQEVYGISWKEGSDILGKVLAAEYAARPMDH